MFVCLFIYFQIKVECPVPVDTLTVGWADITLSFGVIGSTAPIAFEFHRCRAGFYCDDLTSTPCDVGHYCPGEGNPRSVPCPPGKYNSAPGLATCLLAEEGKYAPNEGMPAPLPCPPGEYCPNQGMAFGDLCPAGHYCLGGNTGFSGLNPPLLCALGHYCRPGVKTNVVVDGDLSTMQKCLESFDCPPGSTLPQGLGSCPEGRYCPPNVPAQPCEKGAFCLQEGNRVFSPCPEGKYQNLPEQAQCKPCEPGTYCPSCCESCPRGVSSCPCVLSVGCLNLTSKAAASTPAGKVTPVTLGREFYIICPAGSICPDPGLAAPGSTCPPGM